MRYFCLALLFWFLPQYSALSQPHLDTAKSYIGVKELTGKNDGQAVEKFLKSVGRKKGDHWCAAYVSYCLIVNKVKYPVKMSGLARAFKTKSSINAIDVLTGRYSIPAGTIIVWERGNTITGHTGFVIKQTGKNKFVTVEGNTSSGVKGSQNNGDGVYKRTRSIEPANYFRITAFTLVKY